MEIDYVTWGDGTSRESDKLFPSDHRYKNVGSYDVAVNVKHKDVQKTTLCSKSVVVNSIPGCMNANADNYDPNATVDDGTCDHDFDVSCSDVNFRVTDATVAIDEQVFFLWDNSHKVDSFLFYAGIGSFEVDPTVPVSSSYPIK